MNQETRKKCYQETYDYLQSVDGIRDLNYAYPPDHANYEFSAVLDGIPVEYLLRDKVDLLTLKAVLPFESQDQGEIHSFCRQLKEHYHIHLTPASNKIILKKTPVFTGVNDREAAEMIQKDTKDFIAAVKEISSRYADFLKKKPDMQKEDVQQNPTEEDIRTEQESECTMEKDVNSPEEAAEETESAVQPECGAGQLFHNKEEEVKTDPEQAMHSLYKELCSEYPEASRRLGVLLTDMNAVFDRKMKQMDYREQTLSDYQASLDERERENGKREQDFRLECDRIKAEYERQFQQIGSEKKELELNWKKLNQEKETLTSWQKDIETRAELVDRMRGEKQDAVKYRKKCEELQEKIEELTGHYQEKEQKLRAELTGLQNQAPGNASNEDCEALKQKLECAEEALQSKDGELEELRKSLNDAQLLTTYLKKELGSVLDEKEQLEQLLKEDPAGKEEEGQTARYQECFRELGISMEPVLNEDAVIMTGMHESCKIVFNQSFSMLHMEKAVRRPARYQKRIDEWNQESILTAYMLSGNSVMARASIHENLSKTVHDIMVKFGELK